MATSVGPESCAACHTPLHAGARECHVCYADAGFPNIRVARSAPESEALEKRLADAVASCQARRCNDELEQFRAAVGSSCVVICRSLSIIKRLFESDNELYVCFYAQINSGARLPEDNTWDTGRAAIDSTLFPYYHDKIVFGCLSLSDHGLPKFGDYGMVLDESKIEQRTSVFDENPFKFVKRHAIVAGDAIPHGYRAPWDKRGLLAAAKLHGKIEPKMGEDRFGDVLVSGSGDDIDYIEAHIFGSIHRRAVRKIVGPKPRNGPDQILMESIEEKLRETGAFFEAL